MLSWTLFAALLTVAGPGVVISLLIVLSVHVFSATYYALAKSPGEFPRPAHLQDGHHPRGLAPRGSRTASSSSPPPPPR